MAYNEQRMRCLIGQAMEEGTADRQVAKRTDDQRRMSPRWKDSNSQKEMDIWSRGKWRARRLAKRDTRPPQEVTLGSSQGPREGAYPFLHHPQEANTCLTWCQVQSWLLPMLATQPGQVCTGESGAGWGLFLNLPIMVATCTHTPP